MSVCIASCVLRSSRASFFSISRFRSQFGRFGAILNKSCAACQTRWPHIRAEVLTKSCALRCWSSSIMVSAMPSTFFSTVSSMCSSSSRVCFFNVRLCGSNVLCLMTDSAFSLATVVVSVVDTKTRLRTFPLRLHLLSSSGGR